MEVFVTHVEGGEWIPSTYSGTKGELVSVLRGNLDNGHTKYYEEVTRCTIKVHSLCFLDGSVWDSYHGRVLEYGKHFAERIANGKREDAAVDD